MSALARLKAATSLSDVAELLHFRPKAVSYILYKQPAAAKYRTFQIPKRNGGQRTIKAPIDALKLLQRKLSDLLQDCVDEINTAKKRKDRTAHGFKRRRSIITNARQHRHRRWVFNLDLEDFFPSINFGRVRGFLLKSRDFELNEKVATVIAQIACYEGSLPQGSPCSPVISNLVAHLLDMRLVKLASNAGCTYSRYADDLTFSTNKGEFPSEIAASSGTEAVASNLWFPSKTVQQAVERAGFRINPTKTHMMYRASRQEVTGLVTNVKVNVRRDYRHNVRAMVHKLVTTGGFQVKGVTQKDGQAVPEMRSGTLRELHGMLGFIDSIQVYNRMQTSDYLSHEMSSSEKAYRTFLMYTTFYAAEAPVVICEGETDNIYLRHAIRGLAADFPDLAEVMPDKTIRLRVRLYNYVRSSTARLLGLKGGGSGSLCRFIAAYRGVTSAFTGPAPAHPVIILYDNDKGGQAIRNTIRRVTNVEPTDAVPFVHVTKNMYAVHTPGKAPSKIEDLFDATAKATIVAGKTFDGANEFDHGEHYGKRVFALKVVQAKADRIDFRGFRPLLANLAAVVSKHRASSVPQPSRS